MQRQFFGAYIKFCQSNCSRRCELTLVTVAAAVAFSIVILWLLE